MIDKNDSRSINKRLDVALADFFRGRPPFFKEFCILLRACSFCSQHLQDVELNCAAKRD